MLNNATFLEKRHLQEAGETYEYPQKLTAKQAIEKTLRIEDLWSLREFMESNPEKFSNEDYKMVFEMHEKNQLTRFILLTYKGKGLPEALKKFFSKELLKEWLLEEKRDIKEENITI